LHGGMSCGRNRCCRALSNRARLGGTMRFTTRIVVTAAMAVAAGTAAIPAAQAADPAVTGCAFTPIYGTYENGGLGDQHGFSAWPKQLRVTDGAGPAWFVTVLDGTSRTGWMPAECVRFLA